jgi:hypothetical protein
VTRPPWQRPPGLDDSAEAEGSPAVHVQVHQDLRVRPVVTLVVVTRKVLPYLITVARPPSRFPFSASTSLVAITR